MLVKRDLGEPFHLSLLFRAFVLFREVVSDLAIGELEALFGDLGLYDVKNFSCAAPVFITVIASFSGCRSLHTLRCVVPSLAGLFLFLVICL